VDALSPLTIGSPWTPYGLRDDPFFQQPLQAGDAEGAARPMTLFVGRDEELRILASQVVGSTSSRAIVEGAAGVGKTTFVNRLKTELARHGVLAHADPVRITPGMSPREFVGEVLKVLIQMHATLQATAAADPGGRLQRSFRRGAQVVQDEMGLEREAAFWRRIGRLIQGEDSMAIGATVAMVGVQRERVRISPEVELSLFDELAEALRRLSSGGRRVLVHVDNLETLSQENAAQAARLMQSVRDVFLADGGHWLFAGTTGIADAIFRATPQVGSIIGGDTCLRPLAPPEVAELLRRRYHHLHLGDEVAPLTPPIDPEVGGALYARYRGDLRAFLMLASRAVQRRAIVAPGVMLTASDVVEAMAPKYTEVLANQIGAPDLEHLRTTVGGRPRDYEFRVADFAQATGMKQASASKLVHRMAQVGVIAQTRNEGRSTFYRVNKGDATIALQMT
jgi:hypothetical protein